MDVMDLPDIILEWNGEETGLIFMNQVESEKQDTWSCLKNNFDGLVKSQIIVTP